MWQFTEEFDSAGHWKDNLNTVVLPASILWVRISQHDNPTFILHTTPWHFIQINLQHTNKQLIDQSFHSFTDENPELSRSLMKNFLGLLRSQQMFKYKEKCKYTVSQKKTSPIFSTVTWKLIIKFW